MFENKVYEGIYYSRFIASWIKAGGSINYWARRLGKTTDFVEWLRSLVINGKKMPEDIIYEINDFATCGKLELEYSAKNFITNRK